jgi:hypothetical protein
MALICLATHAGEVPSAGNVVGNQTGTFNKTLSANEGADINVNVIATTSTIFVIFLIIVFLL